MGCELQWPFPAEFHWEKKRADGGFYRSSWYYRKGDEFDWPIHYWRVFGTWIWFRYLSLPVFVCFPSLSLWGTYLGSTQRHIGSPNAQSTQVFTSKQPGSHTPSANVQIHVFLEFRPQMIWTMTSSSPGPYHISLAPECQMSSSGIFPHKSQSRCLGRMMVILAVETPSLWNQLVFVKCIRRYLDRL